MRWARPIGILLISMSRPAVAQSVDQTIVGLETCFQTARLADSICEKQSDPKERLDCFEKTRAAQLECLRHVLPDKSGPSARSPEAAPPASLPSPSSQAPEEVTPKDTQSTGSSQISTEDSSKDTPKADVKANAPEMPAAQEESTGTIQSDTKMIPKRAAPPPTKKDWIISETTSPIDFSALVTAVIQPAEQVSNGPISLTIRCRAKTTELALQFQGHFNAAKARELQLDYQIDDLAFVKQRWIWSTGGKTAVYKGDPVPLLQSIPEGAKLKI